MPNVFLTSDTHFSHRGMCEFVNPDGSKCRPWTNPHEMDEALIANWNSVVQPGDKVYHLGDVAINRKAIALVMRRLNGKKVLIKGNHDIFKLADYTPWFYDIRGSHKLGNMLLSHIPMHPSQLTRFPHNVHGHLHNNLVLLPGEFVPDGRYINVCVEHTNWTPVELGVVMERAR